jgi:hypothetical protein
MDEVAVSMKKPAAGRTAAIKQALRPGASDSEPARLVCAGLALAVITLALRIMSIW